MDSCDFFSTNENIFLRPGGGGGVISLRRKMTLKSFFDGRHYSSLHWL